MIDRDEARAEVRYLDELVQRARLRIDPHAFHYVHWGVIVLLWYPIDNWLRHQGAGGLRIGLGVGSVVLGIGLSAWRERRLVHTPRLQAEDADLVRRIVAVVYTSVVAGTILSGLLPARGILHGDDIPLIWGLVYANIAFVTGHLYRPSFLYGAALIFAGVVMAAFLREQNGYILGPCMGLGILVPGLAAERDVRRQKQELEALAATE